MSLLDIFVNGGHRPTFVTQVPDGAEKGYDPFMIGGLMADIFFEAPV
jgi:hypothetical protein